MKEERIRVVVTGIGAITPLGLSAEETWQGLVDGRSGVGLGETFDASNYPIKIAAEVRGFEPRDYLKPKLIRKTARFSQYALVACLQSLTDAGLLGQEGKLLAEMDSSRAGIIIGTCVGGLVEIRATTEKFLNKGYSKVPPSFIIKMLHNAPAANISSEFGFTGYNSTISTSCASGAHAIGEATEVIRRGKADIMIAGGTESPICDVGLAGFSSMRAMTTSQNNSPTKASKPFDLNRDGLVIGEGAACMILERLEHAQARSAPIYGEVLGFGCSNDAFHLAAPDPEGTGQVKAMKQALDDADLGTADIDYISAHATSTPIGDFVETESIKRVFGKRAYHIPISAAKSMLGHAIGASGAIEGVVSLLTIRDKVIHPTINYMTPDPKCDLSYVPNKAYKTQVNVVLSNSFGMGGQNVVLAFGSLN